jgi:hypothetical protein
MHCWPSFVYCQYGDFHQYPGASFPAISLIMLAYTNRFLALSNRVRSLHDKYQNHEQKLIIHGQIKNLRYRLKLIKNMQALGVVTFLGCILCMYLIYMEATQGGICCICTKPAEFCYLPLTIVRRNPVEHKSP